MAKKRCAPRDTKFSKGDANKIADKMFHPHFDSVWVVILDSIAHFIIEDNPKVSFRKFLRYNAKPLLKALQKEL